MTDEWTDRQNSSIELCIAVLRCRRAIKMDGCQMYLLSRLSDCFASVSRSGVQLMSHKDDGGWVDMLLLMSRATRRVAVEGRDALVMTGFS